MSARLNLSAFETENSSEYIITVKLKNIRNFRTPFELASFAMEILLNEHNYWDKVSEKVNWDEPLLNNIMSDMQEKALTICKKRFQTKPNPPFDETIKEVLRLKKEYLNDI